MSGDGEGKLELFLSRYPEWGVYGTVVAQETAREVLKGVFAAGQGIYELLVGPSQDAGIIVVVTKDERQLVVDVYPDAHAPSFLLSLETTEMEGIIGDRFPVEDLVRSVMNATE